MTSKTREEVVKAVDVLNTVVSIVRRHGSAKLVNEFCKPIESFMNEGGDLAAHLGVKVKQGSSAGKIYFHFKRDSYLRAACAYCENQDKFLDALAEFRNHRWASTKDKKHPPAGWSNLNKNIWRAFATGIYIPCDKTIRSICRTKTLPADSRTGGRDALDLMSDHERKRDKSNA